MSVYEYRRDGWPLCPQCGEDELMSRTPFAARVTIIRDDTRSILSSLPTDPMKCLCCGWTGSVPPQREGELEEPGYGHGV